MEQHENVRKGITNAVLKEVYADTLYTEIAIISIVVGLGTHSWWWGGGVFLSLIICLCVKPLAIVLMLLLSVCWGAIGYGIGYLFGSNAAVVLGILGFLAGARIHFSAFEWVEHKGPN